MTKWVYRFAAGSAEGRADMKNLLGGKGANLAEMSNLGLPVPPGFTITTEACIYYFQHQDQYPAALQADVDAALDHAKPAVHQRITAEDFTGAMAELAKLRRPVDAFFDKVTVNAPDSELRINRLRLLSQIQATMSRVADFSLIEGKS